MYYGLNPKRGGGKELKLGSDTIGSGSDMAASSETITVNITGCTFFDEDDLTFIITSSREKEQILNWAKGKAKFLRLTFKYNNKYHSALFTKDAISNADSLEYDAGDFNVISSIMYMEGRIHVIAFNLNIRSSKKYVAFEVYRIEYVIPL